MKNNYKYFCEDLFNISTDIFSELGSGFNEAVYQNALGIEFRKRNIKYLKEVNIEIFYKDHAVGLDRPDFIILPSRRKGWNFKSPLVIETKVSTQLSNENRAQLKSYLKSLPKNKNNDLKNIKQGVLLKFLKSEDFIESENSKHLIEIELWGHQKAKDKINLIYSLPQKEDE